MFHRRPDRHHGPKLLGIALLTLGLLRLPLPQADYHQIRHQHGPGEVCVHHDHLLRWHPDASETQAVAIFHWHWFAPSAERPDRDDDEGATRPDGPALHAHADGLEPDGIGEVVVQADLRGRCIPPSTHAPTPLEDQACLASSDLTSSPGGTSDGSSIAGPAARRALSPRGLTVRWNC